jgi:hypothetical protein
LRSRNSSIILWRSFVMKRPPWGRSFMMPNYDITELCHGCLKLPILRAALRSSGVTGEVPDRTARRRRFMWGYRRSAGPNRSPAAVPPQSTVTPFTARPSVVLNAVLMIALLIGRTVLAIREESVFPLEFTSEALQNGRCTPTWTKNPIFRAARVATMAVCSGFLNW